MKKLIILCLTVLVCAVNMALAQTDVPLKYWKELPKNLYSAPTAVLINYTTNQEITEAEEARKISEISTQLLTDNQQLGFQLLHFAPKNTLQDAKAKAALLHQYDSLKIQNLLFLEVSEITGLGAAGSYILKLTAYNKTPKMMANNQRAYMLQEDSYANLLRDLKGQISDYSPNYFNKGPARTPAKPNMASEPSLDNPTQKTETPTSTKPLTFPLIKLTVEDEMRGNSGLNKNFYYYLGASQQEKNAGFFGQHLREDIKSSPDALVHLTKYRNYRIGYLAERTVFVTSVVLYAGEVLSGEGYTYFNDRQKVYIGVALGSLLVNALIVRKTNVHIRRAIDEYNAFATMQNQSGFHKLRPDNWSLGAVYNRRVVPGLTFQWNLR